MSQLRHLLIEQLQDLLSAEQQLVKALPKMASASKNPKLRENFEVHLAQTERQVERLEEVFSMLGEKPKPKPCKAMMGLVEEGKETIEEGKEKEPLASDLALITAAQKVEHYEIAGYGTVKVLARQIGEIEISKLLERTLGEEEATDALLTMCAKPLLQQASLEDYIESSSEDEEVEKAVPPPSKRARGTKEIRR